MSRGGAALTLLPEIVSVAVPGPTAVGLELLILLQGPSRPCVSSATQVQGSMR